MTALRRRSYPIPGHRPAVAAAASIGRLLQAMTSIPEWMARGICAQTDPDSFFPEKGGSTLFAKKVCRNCPVRTECLEYALEHDERYGVWGGKSEPERRQIKHQEVA